MNEIKNIIATLELVEYLANYNKLNTFIEGKWQLDRCRIHYRSYAFLFLLLFDYLAREIATLENTEFFEFDYRLERGIHTDFHFSIFCTNKERGKLIHYIYDNFNNAIANSDSVKSFFLKINGLILHLKRLFELFDYNIDNIEFKSIHNYLENIFDPIAIPAQTLIEFQTILNHYFCNLNEYLEFFKDYNGEWISADGFFLAISYAYSLILDEKVRKKYPNLMIFDKLPFQDFSQEKNSFFDRFSLVPDEIDASSRSVYIFTSDEGMLPIFRCKNVNMLDFIKNIKEVGDLLYENHEFDCRRKNENELRIKNGSKINFLEKLKVFPELDELYLIPKLFDYNKTFSISLGNPIQEDILFKIISNGQINYKNNDTKIRVNIFEILTEEEQQNKILKNKEILEVELNDNRFIFNRDFYKESLNYRKERDKLYNHIDPRSKKVDPGPIIIFGYFFENNVYGSAVGNDYTFWIGTMGFGSNDDIALYENREQLVEFLKNHKERLVVNHYIISFSLFRYFTEFLSNQPIPMGIHVNTPFSLFFDSTREIRDEILLNDFKEAYGRFEKSFSNKNVSNNEKKEALEELMETISRLSKEFKVLGTNVLGEAEEIDLVIETKPLILNISEILGKIFLVECRNLKSKITAKQIRDFGGKLKTHNIKTGLIVTREGITGTKQNVGAKQIIRDFANQGHLILVIDKEDLKEITDGTKVEWIIVRAFCRSYFKGMIKHFPSS